MIHGGCGTLEPSMYTATHLELCNSYQKLTRFACVTLTYRISQRQENPVCPDRKTLGWTGGWQAGCLMALSVFAYQIWECRLCGQRAFPVTQSLKRMQNCTLTTQHALTPNFMQKHKNTLTAWSVALCFKIWCCRYPSNIISGFAGLHGQVSNSKYATKIKLKACVCLSYPSNPPPLHTYFLGLYYISWLCRTHQEMKLKLKWTTSCVVQEFSGFRAAALKAFRISGHPNGLVVAVTPCSLSLSLHLTNMICVYDCVIYGRRG